MAVEKARKIVLGGDYDVENDEKGFYKVDVIASLFGLSVRRVQQLTQEGIISTVQTSAGRRYELAPTIQKYIQYLSDKAYGKSKSETEAQLKEKKLKADIALKESQGELHRLKTEIATGQYISIEEIKMDYSRFFVSFKKFAMSVPSRLAGKMTGFVDPVEIRRIEKEMQREVTKLLNGFVISAVVEEKETNGKAKD